MNTVIISIPGDISEENMIFFFKSTMIYIILRPCEAGSEHTVKFIHFQIGAYDLSVKLSKLGDNILDDIAYYGKDEDIFNEEIRFQHACSFCLFQIGEYTKRLSESIRNDNPQVNWRDVAGLRDVIGHAYGKIHLPSIWVTITEEVPVLKKECEIILRRIE